MRSKLSIEWADPKWNPARGVMEASCGSTSCNDAGHPDELALKQLNPVAPSRPAEGSNVSTSVTSEGSEKQ